jgi:hypothetical protein
MVESERGCRWEALAGQAEVRCSIEVKETFLADQLNPCTKSPHCRCTLDLPILPYVPSILCNCYSRYLGWWHASSQDTVALSCRTCGVDVEARCSFSPITSKVRSRSESQHTPSPIIQNANRLNPLRPNLPPRLRMPPPPNSITPANNHRTTPPPSASFPSTRPRPLDPPPPSLLIPTIPSSKPHPTLPTPTKIMKIQISSEQGIW